MRRRRALPEHLEPVLGAFAEAAGEVELAKAALLMAIPSARAPALPLAEVLLRFRERLDRAAGAMPGWRVPETEEVWGPCALALPEARAREEAVRLREGDLPHDQLLFTLQDLIAPLTPFEPAALRLAALRRGRS